VESNEMKDVRKRSLVSLKSEINRQTEN